MKKKTDEPPPVVNRRWQVIPIDDVLDRALAGAPERIEWTRDELKETLRGLLASILQELTFATFEKAAGRGIEQAINLLFDPEYYMNATARRRRAREREEARKHAREADDLRKQCNPTRMEVERDLGYAERWLADNLARRALLEERVAELKAKRDEMAPPGFDDDESFGSYRS